MSKTRWTYCGLFAGLVALTPVAQAAAVAAGHGHVAKWVAGAALVGAPSDDEPVQIAIHLAAKNPTGLKSFVADVSNPASRNYGKYLTASQFAQRYAPSEGDVKAVRNLMASADMSKIVVGPHGMYVSATATVRQLRTAFNVGQSLYRYKGKTLRANDGEPVLPAALAGKILYVQGLDETTALRTPFHRSATMGAMVAPKRTASAFSADRVTAAVTPPPVAANNPSPYCNKYFGQYKATLSTAADVYGKQIPWLICGYTPQQIQAAYGIDRVPYNGKGVTVAIVDAFASPTLLSDANRFSANHGLPKLDASNFSQIIPVDAYDVPEDQVENAYGWWGEQALDMAAVHGAAPGAKILYVGATDNETSLDIALFNVVYNHLAHVVTNSYGFTGEAGLAPDYIASYDQALMSAAAMGMTMLYSSGDNGDVVADLGAGSGSYPATSNYVTAVGGTSLALTNANGSKSEYGWGTYRDYLADVKVNSKESVTTSGLTKTTVQGYDLNDFSYYGGAGGGISLAEPQPDWQVGVVPTSLATSLNLISGYIQPLSALQRVSPDVAMLADPYTGYAVGQTFTKAGDAVNDAGCRSTSATEEYCEVGFGGTSLASPLMAGVVAIMNQKRLQTGKPLLGFANPLFYSHGSGATLQSAGFNQISAPRSPVAVLRGYLSSKELLRLITINSVTTLINESPYPIVACGLTICEGVNGIFNYTSNAYDYQTGATTPAGYNAVTGLGVPYVPKLLDF